MGNRINDGICPIKLELYDNSWYHPGRHKILQIAWYYLGLPLLRSWVVPFPVIKCLILRVFGAKIGRNVVIKPGVRVKYPWRIKIGNFVWIGEDAWIDNLANIEIEDNVCLSQGVYLCTGNHDWSDQAFGLRIAPIHLSSGCWLGAKSCILPGVCVGVGGIVAAGSVVVKDVPAWEIHSGNPAAFRKHRRINVATERRESGIAVTASNA
jgi:putative colanic acid biosynthesis acetyltransferase WcaF